MKETFFIYLGSENDTIITTHCYKSAPIENKDPLGHHYVKNVELLFLVLKHSNVLV